MPGPRFTPQYSGYKQSAKWRIKKAKQMIDWEREAKERGVPIARVMAEAIALQELTKLKEQTQAEEEQLEISRGVDIGDSYVPWDRGESYVTGLEARIARLEAVAENAVIVCQMTEKRSMVHELLSRPLKAAGYLRR